MLRSTLDVFAVFFLFLASGKGQEILESPENQTVALGSNATVSCRTNGLLRWRVTQKSSLVDVSVDSQISDLAGEGIYILGDALGMDTALQYSSTVVITGTTTNNGTVLHCSALALFTVTSNPATVLVFGNPAPPTDLTALIVAPLQLNLSWDEPFAPPGVEISYLVSAESFDMDDEYTSEEIHSTYYIFEGSHPCEKYRFTVIAVNTAGRSEGSQAINMSVPALPDIMVEVFRQLVHIEEHAILVEIIFKALQACPAYPVTNYTLALTNVVTGTSSLLGPYFIMEDGTVTISANTLDDDIEENVHYTYIVSAHNVVGTTSFKSGEFYTTDVQLAEAIAVNDDIINIKCYFARGSEALGCSVELVSPEDSALWNITRENGSLVAEGNITTPLPAHCYNISVYDLESDGTVGEVAVLVVGAEWDERCSSDSNNGTGAPPTSGKEAETTRSVGAIVGGSVGGVVITSIILVLLLTMVIYKRQHKPGPLKTEVNPAYEMPCVPRPSTSSSVGQGNEPAVSPTHEYEEVPVSFRDVLQTQMLSEGYLYDNDEDIAPQTNPSYMHT